MIDTEIDTCVAPSPFTSWQEVGRTWNSASRLRPLLKVKRDHRCFTGRIESFLGLEHKTHVGDFLVGGGHGNEGGIGELEDDGVKGMLAR